jgi:cellulose synthase/poly-beta-1,6-N-acetylglucosamine synthase-like glycosyltransferase
MLSSPVRWFDWAMLIPYFAVLALSVYGMHRYEIIRTYFKHRKKATGEPPLRASSSHRPPVTIQLPLFNERYVVERLIDEVVKIEYPRELLQIQVLDDSTDDTAPVCRSAGGALPRAGLPDRIPSPHQSRRVQGRRAAGRIEDRHRRIRGHFRRRFRARRPIS